jgi:perosamine synthetase
MAVKMAQPLVGREEKRAVSEVMDSGMLAQGPRVEEFERRFASYCGVAHAVALSSGTAALHAALHAAGIAPGDEVITTPFTFVATAAAVLMRGAVPVFADIDPETFNLDPERVRAALTDGTKAVIAVHLYGLPCPMDELTSLARDRGLVLIEDACQAHGSEYRGRKVGSLGDLGCFSFYATKNMTCGEGGMITTDDGEAARRVRRFRFHGQEPGERYAYRELGYNYRLTDLAAAMGIRQLEKLPAMNEARRRNALLYNRLLRDVPGIYTPFVHADGVHHVFHQYTLRVKEEEFGLNRDDLSLVLSRAGIETGIHYPVPLHLTPPFKQLGYRPGDLPHAERASREVLSLPVGPHVCEAEVAYVARCIREVATRAAP